MFFRSSSEELKAIIAQYQNGLITECDLVIAMQVTPEILNQLVTFSDLDPKGQDWKFQLDDFNKWRGV